MPKDLEARLEEVSPMSIGRPLSFRFTVTNSTKRDVYVLTWGTPLEGLLSDCIDVIKDGKRLEYDGMLLKRGLPPPEAYVLIKSAKSTSAKFDLSLAYPVKKSGQYTIRLRNKIQFIP